MLGATPLRSTPAVATSPGLPWLHRVAAHCFLLLILALPWSIAPMSVAVALVAASTVPIWLANRDRSWLTTPMTWGALAWIGALGLSAAFAEDPAASAARLTKGLFPALVPLAAWHARTLESGRRAVAVLLASSGVAWLVGLGGYLLQGATYPARARGPSGHYMTFAGQLELIASVALGIALVSRGRWRRVAAAVATLGLLCLIVTYTRSAWLGTLVSAALLLALWRARWVAALVLVVLVAFPFAPAPLRDRVTSIVDPRHETNVERTHMWSAGLQMLRDHPITGVGLQDLKPIYDRYRPPEAHERAGHLHSVPIHVAATMGVVGLAALALLVVGLFRCATQGLRPMLRAARRAHGDRAEDERLAAGLRLGVLGALAAFMVSGLFEWNLGDEEVLYPLYVLAGLAWAARGWERPRPTLVERARRVVDRVANKFKREPAERRREPAEGRREPAEGRREPAQHGREPAERLLK